MNELSIIVPCIYSAENMPNLIDELSTYLMVNPADIDLIVVANEQAAGTEDISAYVRSKYPWIKFTMLRLNGGLRSYGALVRFGLAYSTSQYALLLSAHGDDDISLIPLMLAQMREGAQIVQANRYSSAEDSGTVEFKFRIYQNIYRLLLRCLLGLKVSDSTYGFKMFDRVFIQSLGLSQNNYGVSSEITLKGLLAGGKIEYLPSKMKKRQGKEEFKLFRDGLGYLWILARGALHRIGILWF